MIHSSPTRSSPRTAAGLRTDCPAPGSFPRSGARAGATRLDGGWIGGARSVACGSCPCSGRRSRTSSGRRRATRCTPTLRCSASWRCRCAGPAATAARGVAPDRAWLGDGAATGAARLGSAGGGARPTYSRGGRRAQRRLCGTRPAGFRPSGWRGLTGGARGGTPLCRRGRDQRDATGGVVDRPARRGRRARPVQPRAGRRLLHGGDACRACARGVPRAVSRSFDAGQRVVGLVRPGGEPVLRLAADPPSEEFIMRNAMDAQEAAIGWWPGDPRYGRAAFYAYAHPAPQGFSTAKLSPPAARGERRWASTSLTGTMFAPSRTRTKPCSSSLARRSAMPARCANGTRRSQRARTGPHHPSGETTSDRHRETGCRAAAERSDDRWRPEPHGKDERTTPGGRAGRSGVTSVG